MNAKCFFILLKQNTKKMLHFCDVIEIFYKIICLFEMNIIYLQKIKTVFFPLRVLLFPGR